MTASAAASVRDRRAAAERTAVVVAGPRASMVLLSALPLAGPVAALVVGMPPARLYDSAAVAGARGRRAGPHGRRVVVVAVAAAQGPPPGHTDGAAR